VTDETQRVTQTETTEANVGSPPQDVVRKGGTFEAFRYRAYALFWSGAVVSNVGTWMQNYALGIVVYAFRHSELDLGLVNFLAGIPTFLLAIPGGAIADRFDKRKLIGWAQAALGVLAAALALLYGAGMLTSAHPIEALAWVSAIGVGAGVMTALSFPAWQAMIPDLVPRPTLQNAIALNSAQFQSARLLGPLVAGAMVVAGAGMGQIFWVNAISFLFVIAAVALAKPQFVIVHPSRSGKPGESAWHRITAGVRFAASDHVIGTLILTTVVITIFAMPYMMLLPAIVDKALLGASLAGKARTDAIAQQVSYLMGANGLGAVAGALIVASLPRTVRRERLVRYTLLTLSAVLVAFSFSRSLWVSLPISALAGAALLTTNSLANTSIQASAPPHLRGRVIAVYIMAFMGIMPISALLFGILGNAIGPTNAILAGALVTMAWSLFLVARPGLLTPHELPAVISPTD
jgi:MFS family permease